MPGQVPGDLDDDESSDYFSGKEPLLIDLYSEFQGLYGARLFIAFLFPGIMVASVIFEWASRPELALLGAAAIFIACISISFYSLIWFLWVKKRLRIAEDMMRKKYEKEQRSTL